MERREFVTSLMVGGCAGMCADLTLYPLDTIKTRMQSKEGFFKAGGFRNIYAGVLSVAIGSAPNCAVFFVTYECIKSMLGSSGWLATPHMALVTHMLAASLGEVVACLILVPTEEVKQRTQASPGSTSYYMLRTLLQEEGIDGLYRGYGSTLLRDIPLSIVEYPLWEYLKILWKKTQGHTLFFWQLAVCGAVAAVISAFVTTPMDVAKTRTMLTEPGMTTETSSIPLILYNVWRSEGISGLFVGSIPRMTFIGVRGFILLGAYEQVRRSLLHPPN